MMNSRRQDPSPSPLVTYIGYITGPRAEQPAGVRVVEPPPNTRQAQRGNLYIVVELFGEHPDRAAVGEQLLSELQQAYYAAKGSQSQVMVDAIQRAQAVLREVNAHSRNYPLQAGMLCAALLNGKLLVVTSGPAFAVVHADDRVHVFPSDPQMASGGFGNSPVELFRQDLEANDALFLAGGSWLHQVQLRTLAGIVAYTTAETCSDAADELFDQAGHEPIPGLLIALAARQGPAHRGPSGPGPSAPGPGGPPTRPPAPRRTRFGGLPAALTTPPPARMPPVGSEGLPPPPAAQDEGLGQLRSAALDLPAPPMVTPVEAEPYDVDEPADSLDDLDAETVLESTLEEALGDTSPAAPYADASYRDVPDVDPAPDEVTSQSPPDSSVANQAMPQDASRAVIAAMEAAAVEAAAKQAAARTVEIASPRLPQEPDEDVEPLFPAGTEENEEQEQGPGWQARMAARAAGGWQATRGFITRMLPERRPVRPPDDVESEPDDAAEMIWPEVDVAPPAPQPAPRREVMELAHHTQAAEWAPAATPVMPPISTPQRTRGPRARLLIAVSILILVLVPTVVAAIHLGQGNNRWTQAASLTARADLLLSGAQTALDEGDRAVTIELLTEARNLLAEAIELDGINEERSRLISIIEVEMQEVLRVTPLYGLTAPILTFPAEARPRKVVVVSEDVFVLDAGRQAVVQYRYDPATRTADSQPGQIIVRQGEVVDGVVVGTPADIVYLPLTPGVVDRPSLLIVDRNNNLFRFDPRVAGVTGMNLAGRTEWGSISRIQTYNGLIYLADEGRNQILRYNPAQPDLPATAWFDSQTQVNLAGLMSVEIDGDIWLLFSNGMILRYRSGEQLPFSPENSIALAEEPSDMVVTWRESANIYLVDAAQERILVYDKSGVYLQQLRAPEEHLLRGLASLYIDEVSGVMFILTQTGLFIHPLIQ